MKLWKCLTVSGWNLKFGLSTFLMFMTCAGLYADIERKISIQ